MSGDTPTTAEKPVANASALPEEEIARLTDGIVAGIKTVYDPEIPVNIVDLGLIYDCHLSALNPGTFKADVKMTLTAPGCGMGPMLAQPGWKWVGRALFPIRGIWLLMALGCPYTPLLGLQSARSV